jgi:hypothetical protein
MLFVQFPLRPLPPPPLLLCRKKKSPKFAGEKTLDLAKGKSLPEALCSPCFTGWDWHIYWFKCKWTILYPQWGSGVVVSFISEKLSFFAFVYSLYMSSCFSIFYLLGNFIQIYFIGGWIYWTPKNRDLIRGFILSPSLSCILWNADFTILIANFIDAIQCSLY